MSKIDKLQVLGLIALLVLAFFVTGWLKMSQNQECENPTKTIVEIETTKGLIVAEIYNKEVPITSANFLKLTKNQFYDGLTFHRYEPGFVIQGGDPKGTGSGGSNESIKLEINPELKHIKGALAMARTNDPNSATSQFYITLAPSHFLDGSYAVFGLVIEGMDNALELRAKDVINSIKITKQLCD